MVLLAVLVLPAVAQMKTGRGMIDFNKTFKLDDKLIPNIQITLLETNAPGCMYIPGEQPAITFQFENKTGKPIKVAGKAELMQYAARGIPGDIWMSKVIKLRDCGTTPVEVDLPARGWKNITIKPKLPPEKGGYALILDLGDHGRDFICGIARIFKPVTERIQYPKQSLDNMEPAVLERLGVQAIRKGWGYHNSEHPGYKENLEKLAAEMEKFHQHKVTIVLEFGAGRHDRPIPVTFRTHLTEDGRLKGGKGDMCWMPKDDEDFEEFVYKIACKHGWPKGPITGFMLWNEPWEGLSISGWGADMIRYRKIYKHIGKAVERARKDAKVDILVGGCDSSTNTWDKLFPDGSDEMMKYFDFCSIHYQGMSAPVLHPEWRNRKLNKGRVLIWDTESWVANTDDRVAGVVATNRAAGYDRALGVFFGNICTQMSHNRSHWDRIKTENGIVKHKRPLFAWPVAASMSAVQHFIGEREFKEILFTKGLPWVYVFDGLKDNPDDGTIVVIGDIGAAFTRSEQMLFRNVRSLRDAESRARLQKRIESLPEGARERKKLEGQMGRYLPMLGCSMTVAAPDDTFGLFDFYGNRAPTRNGRITIPLNSKGYFLRARPDRKGSFAKLVKAVRTATIKGYEPAEIIAHDMLKPIDQNPVLRVDVNNILNRPIKGQLSVTLGKLQVEHDRDIALGPHESKQVKVKVTGGKPTANNTYKLDVRFDAGGDGVAVHSEDMHVNYIVKRTIKVDGKLDDWKEVLPQNIIANEKAKQTITEAAWLPFVKFDVGAESGFASGFLAYDDKYFYFAAKIVDSSKHPGVVRFATRDDDQYFYPKVSYEVKNDRYGVPVERKEYVWPDGVRRYTYRTWPLLPDGRASRFDNVQIAFNAIPRGEDGWLSHLPGRMPGFTYYKCTDYEYALNAVAPKYGGGFEVWRLQIPGMPRKHFYPRQPKHPLEGPAKGAKLITKHEENTRITEVALPWSEIPHVKKLLDAGKTVKFTFGVNNNTRGPVMELAKERSVSKRNGMALHCDWSEHWANELEFAFEK